MMFPDQTQYKGNRPADTESEGFVPIDQEPIDYLEGLRSKIKARDSLDAKPKVEEYRNSLPGPSPDPEYYDYPRMLEDNMQPKVGGEGVAPFPVEYYAKGHEPFDEWVMDANTGTYQPGNATTRVALGAARDIAQGAFEYLLQGSSEDIITLSEGVIAGSKIAAGVGVKALTDLFADNPDPASYDNIIDDAIQEAHDIAYNPPSLPEIAGGDPETAKGIAENIGRDLSILLGGVVAGNKAMPAKMFAVEVPKMMNWYRKTMATIKKAAMRERGVVAAELIYSKVGEGGNLSTLLNEMGYGNELTEWLDSSIKGQESQMAMKNVVEGVITSKMLQAFFVTGRGAYRYARAGGFDDITERLKQGGMPTGSPGSQRGAVGDLGKDGLIVQHNISEEGIRHAEKMGGLASPSLAVVKAKQPLEGFGDVSLLGKKEMAKPSAGNPVFSADGYTPRYPYIEDGKIFKGYTQMGNRKYAPHTLDNVVKHMRKEMRDGDGETSMFGAGALRAHLAPRFRNITQIKASRNKIKSDATMQEYKEASNDKLIELANKLTEYSSHKDPNPFIANDVTINRIEELAQGYDNWDEYFPDAPPEIKTQVLEFFNELKQAPTTYFEVKPQRAVDMGEFHTALVPADVEDDVVKALRARGLNVEKFIDAADKRKKMMKMDDLLFGIMATAVGLGANENNEKVQ